MKLAMYPTKADWEMRWHKLKNFFFEIDPLRHKFSLTRKTQLLLAIIFIITIVAITDWPVLSCQALTYDDGQYLINNNLVKAVSWESGRRFLTEVFSPSTVGGYYQPLTMLSLMVDFLFTGRIDDLTIFHRTNLTLHLINVSLMALFIYLLFHNVWVAAFTGLLFGLHPMTVESVTWLAERKTLLAAMFSLGALICYLRYCSWQGRKKFYLNISLVMYLLALMSKPISLPLPLVMLLLDYWPLQRFQKKVIYEKKYFYLLGIILGIITYISQKNTCIALIPTENPIYLYNNSFNLISLILAIVWQVFFYLTKFFWPYPVSHRYPFPKIFTLDDPMVLLSFIGIILVLLLCIKAYPRFKSLVFGLSIVIVMLFPTMGIVGVANTLVADRYIYLPSFGFLIMIAAFLELLHKKMSSMGRKNWLGIGLGLLFSFIIIGEICVVRNYFPVWKDSETLARYSIRMSPQDTYAYANLGSVLMKKEDYPGAIDAYQNAIRLGPKLGQKLYYSLGQAYFANGNYGEALTSYQEYLKFAPQSYLPYFAIGQVFYVQKKYDEAKIWFNQALEREENNFYLNSALAEIYRLMGNTERADFFFAKANEILSKPH